MYIASTLQDVHWKTDDLLNSEVMALELLYFYTSVAPCCIKVFRSKHFLCWNCGPKKLVSHSWCFCELMVQIIVPVAVMFKKEWSNDEFGYKATPNSDFWWMQHEFLTAWHCSEAQIRKLWMLTDPSRSKWASSPHRSLLGKNDRFPFWQKTSQKMSELCLNRWVGITASSRSCIDSCR